MTALVVAVAVAAGVACTEFMTRTLRGSAWLPATMQRTRDLLEEFRRAGNDDARQSAIIRAGASTLGLSVAFLAWITMIATLLMLPAAAFGWEVTLSPLYLGVASVAALVWWAWRWRGHAR